MCLLICASISNRIVYFFKAKSHEEMEERTETGLVKGHAYGVTAIKKVSKFWRLRQGK